MFWIFKRKQLYLCNQDHSTDWEASVACLHLLFTTSYQIFIIFHLLLLKFVFCKKATKIDEIFTVDLTVWSKCQIDGEDFVKFSGLLGKHGLYILTVLLDFVTNYHQTKSCQNAPLYSLDTWETSSLSMTGWFWCWKEENIMYKTLCILDKYYIIYIWYYEYAIIRYLHKFNLFRQEVSKYTFLPTDLLLTYTVFVRSYVYLNSISQCCIIWFTKSFIKQYSNF